MASGRACASSVPNPIWPLPSEESGKQSDAAENEPGSTIRSPRRKRQANSGFALPQGDERELLHDARRLGAGSAQLDKARGMQERGLSSKARRQAFCGVLGVHLRCPNGPLDSQHGPANFFRRYRCKNRYCLDCGPVLFAELFKKHVRLRQVVERLVPHWPCQDRRPDRVVAKIDFTTKKFGRMPTTEEAREFNRLVRQFWRRIECEFDISRADYGFLWCDEFGGRRNTNLHAHGLYAGPWLPQKHRELSFLWAEVCKGTSFDGSFIVSIKTARSFEAGLKHALKYAGKFLSKDPARLAELEAVFHGVRRVHTLAAFYNPDLSEEEPSPDCATAGLMCPECGAELLRGGSWLPVHLLIEEGCEDLEEVRRRIARAGVLRGPPG